MGRYDWAIASLKKATTRIPNHMPTHTYLIASYVELGREEEARAEAAEILRISPDYRTGSKSRAPWKDQAVPERIGAALRKAGLK